ncbi:Alpha/Beta hydrolase fold [Fusarium oxysporum f. sp. vasinfectum]|nr:Alpha/Beta hydrolase fold [Fusarium oxysporum f. sp. vasinfectum]
MDQPNPTYAVAETEEGIPISWEPRWCQFDHLKEELWLGQHNADDTSTRTKITHIDFFGLGVIGSVCSVAYGTWSDSPTSPTSPAALVVMQFDFRAGSGPLRYKSAEISISFKGQKPGTSHPVIHQFFPTSNKSRGSQPALRRSASMLPSDPFIWSPDEFIIRGKTWLSKGVQEPDEVTWTINEIHGSHRRGRSHHRNQPYQDQQHSMVSDDPLLFDCITHKGMPLPATNLNELESQALADYIALASPSSSALSTVVSGLVTAPSSSPKQESTSTSSGAVYRVQGIPATCIRGQFIKGLATALNLDATSIRIHSFMANPYGTRVEMMSVLSFHKTPDFLCVTSTKKEWHLDVTLPSQGTESTPAENTTIKLLFDTHFLGFSVVGTPFANSDKIEVDIVAVHGLGGHAYGSFKERGGSYMWLEDSLPAHLRAALAGCAARILLYGYDARVENTISFQSIHDLAGRLRGSLRAIRPGIIKKRPLVYIGHSLGGLIIKENEPGGDETDMLNLRATRGALFFGVPHRGMDNSALLAAIGLQANREFLESLRIGSPELEKQSQLFSSVSALDGSVIFSFFETCVSGTAKMDNGKLTMNGDPAILVSKDSANHTEEYSRFLIPINRSHSELVKFERYSDDYERVLGCLQEILETTREIITRRLANMTL